MGYLDEISTDLNNAVTSSNSGGTPLEQGKDLGSKLYGPVAEILKKQVFTILVTVLLFITIAFVFYGGFLYFTAYGDENRATMAKKTITYAIIGFIIAGVAFAIVSFVRSTAEKASTGNGTQVEAPLENINVNQETDPFKVQVGP